MLRDILDIKHALNREITLLWAPSHTGIQGNEVVDRLANEATKKSAVDIDIGIELAEAYSTVDDYCRGKCRKSGPSGQTTISLWSWLQRRGNNGSLADE